MLFLLNDKVIEVNAPEAHLLERWRTIGCGDPRQMRAHDAVEFAATCHKDLLAVETDPDSVLFLDIAALIIAKTGANSLILKPTASGGVEPRLRDIPPLVLETYLRGAANDQDERVRA
ncbi:MAG: hypothetical protein AAFQ12_14120 [Pseudomonadota bacterium]